MGAIFILFYLYGITLFLIGLWQFIEFIIHFLKSFNTENNIYNRKLRQHGWWLGIYFGGLYLVCQINLIPWPILLYVFGLPWIFILNWIKIKKLRTKKILTEHIIDDVLIN